MITLYDYVLSGNCYKVRLLASLLGIELRYESVDFHPGKAHRSAEFKKINPLCELPVVRDKDLVLRDAQAILVHLASRYDATDTWYPLDEAGNVQQWLAFADRLTQTASAARLHDMLGYELDIEYARTGAAKALRILDDHLHEQEIMGQHWLVGENPTVADIACFPYVAMAEDGGISLNDYSAIRHWVMNIKRLENFITMPGIATAF